MATSVSEQLEIST